MIRNHYEVLGVPANASTDAIRVAYRQRARLFHPDRAGVSNPDDAAMSAVNEAYRVLSDPGRRAVYDRALATTGATVGREVSAQESEVDEPWDSTAPAGSRLDDSGPARVPWRLMLIVAAIGSALVIVGSAFNDPPSVEAPDGILRTGSCVEIQANTDVREIQCTGTGDLVVEFVIPIDATCPVGTRAHRDRLGLGTACISAD